MQTIYENISPYFDRFLSQERGLMERNYQNLCRILEAIEKRDSDATRLPVQNHVRYFNRKMEEGNTRAKV